MLISYTLQIQKGKTEIAVSISIANKKRIKLRIDDFYILHDLSILCAVYKSINVRVFFFKAKPMKKMMKMCISSDGWKKMNCS